MATVSGKEDLRAKIQDRQDFVIGSTWLGGSKIGSEGRSAGEEARAVASSRITGW